MGTNRELWAKLKNDMGYTHPDSISPSLDKVYEAAEIANVGDDAITWAIMQLNTFLELSRQRTRYQGGCNALSLLEIQAYLALNSIQLHPVELNIILELDRIFMNFITDQLSESLERAKKGQA